MVNILCTNSSSAVLLSTDSSHWLLKHLQLTRSWSSSSVKFLNMAYSLLEILLAPGWISAIMDTTLSPVFLSLRNLQLLSLMFSPCRKSKDFSLFWSISGCVRLFHLPHGKKIAFHQRLPLILTVFMSLISSLEGCLHVVMLCCHHFPQMRHTVQCLLLL